MSTNENSFLFAPGELTLPPEVLHDGHEHGGVAVLISRVILLLAKMSNHDKALTICGHLKAVGLETNESVIRVYNLPKSDVGQTDHQAVAVLKPTGGEEEQLTYLCADSEMGSETVFKLECGAIPPLRAGMMSRAIASHLPFNGAPAETIGVFAGIALQSKQALTQRLPILQEGLRQMALDAAQLATQEQTEILAKHRSLIDAGDGASSPEAVEHAEHGAEFSAEVIECLQLIPTEPADDHYDINLTGLN